MSRPVHIHPSIELDPTVERKGESETHWAIKAAIIHKFRSNPLCQGEVLDEKKTEELIGDVRCRFDRAPPEMPRNCVVEVQTEASDKDILRATALHLRFGYAVFWVFDIEAVDDQRDAEDALADYMSTRPSFGIASLEDGELSLGSPVTWESFDYAPQLHRRNELYIPTYYRQKKWFDHGEFDVDGRKVTVYEVEVDGESTPYISTSSEEGQLTLPEPSPWKREVLFRKIRRGGIPRTVPVRGPP